MSSWSLIINNRGFLYFNQHKSNRKEAAAARKQLLTWSLLQSDLRLTQSLQQVQKPVTHSGYQSESQSGQWWKQEELFLSSVSVVWWVVCGVVQWPMCSLTLSAADVCRCVRGQENIRERVSQLDSNVMHVWFFISDMNKIHSRFMVVMVTHWVILATNKNRQERRLTHTIKQEITDRRLHNGHDYMITDTQTDA